GCVPALRSGGGGVSVADHRTAAAGEVEFTDLPVSDCSAGEEIHGEVGVGDRSARVDHLLGPGEGVAEGARRGVLIEYEAELRESVMHGGALGAVPRAGDANELVAGLFDVDAGVEHARFEGVGVAVEVVVGAEL